MSAALKPWTVRGVEVPNRIAVPPMCTWLSDPMTNEPNDRHLTHYGGLANGGVGLIIMEASPVELRGRIDPGDMGIFDDRSVPLMKSINDYIHKNTQTKTAIQIQHAGRKGTTLNCMTPTPTHLGPEDKFGTECIGASPIPFDSNHRVPREMTTEDLEMVKQGFVRAALRAVKAEFDMIEIHGAHGYLLSSFTSPLSNQRTDQYGGSLENRLRYPLEVIAAIRAAIPASMPLIVRISAEEWVPGGFTCDDAVVYAKKMKQIGVDIVHVSSGGNNKDQKFPRVPQFQIPLAERVRQEADIPVIAVGMVEKLADASAIVEDGKADMVAIGRAMLKNPYWLRNECKELKLRTWFPMQEVGGQISLRKLYTGQDDEEITFDKVNKVLEAREVAA